MDETLFLLVHCVPLHVQGVQCVLPSTISPSLPASGLGAMVRPPITCLPWALFFFFFGILPPELL